MALCGKGGSGKSAVTSLLAQGMEKRGYRVLVVDADDSNPGLYRMLGFDSDPSPLLGLAGGRKGVWRIADGEPLSSEVQGGVSVLVGDQISARDIPFPYMLQRGGMRLVVVGKILQSHEGCACAMGRIARQFLERLQLAEDEVVLVDMEAGVEHFGRGVETALDTVLAVVEPSFESVAVAEKIATLAAQMGVSNVWAIINKASSAELALKLREKLESRGVGVAGSIRFDPMIFEADMEGRQLFGSTAAEDIGAILDRLLL